MEYSPSFSNSDTVVGVGDTEMGKRKLECLADRKSNRKSAWSRSIGQDHSWAVPCVPTTICVLEAFGTMCGPLSFLPVACEPAGGQCHVSSLVSGPGQGVSHGLRGLHTFANHLYESNSAGCPTQRSCLRGSIVTSLLTWDLG